MFFVINEILKAFIFGAMLRISSWVYFSGERQGRRAKRALMGGMNRPDM